jgi:glutaredoxin
MTRMKALLAAFSCCLALSAGAQIYKWTDSTGKVHYSDKAPEGTKTEQLKMDAVTSYEGPPQVDNWQAIIRRPTSVEGLKPRAEAASRELTMYATSWCGYCKKARIYFEAKGIKYREVDIEASAANREEFRQYGGKGVPLFINGERRMRGFTEASMDRFLASTR